ncbi:MAG: acetylglutamate kinase [Lentisphaerota bacterium]
MKTAIAKAAVLLEAMPYIQKFKGSTVVIKFGGSVLENQELANQALRDIVFLEMVGIKVVIVHGGGKEISAELEKMAIPVKFIKGQRYTCKKTIKVVDDVLHNIINPRIVSTIESHGGKAVKLSGKNILVGHKLEPSSDTDNADLGFVGEVHNVDTREIKSILKDNIIPVITPLALGEDGKTIFNINADIAAAKVAEMLKANKLVFISDVPGVLKDSKNEDTLISTIYSDEIESYILDGTISGGMIPKIKSAQKALNAGANKVHMIDGRVKHSILLEIFTDTGIGTQILPVKN